MSLLLFLALSIAVLLLVVVLIARFTLVARSSRLSAGWIAAHFALLSSPLAAIASECQAAWVVLLRWPVKRLSDNEPYHSPVALLFRLVCLPLCVPVIVAEFPIAQLRSDAFYHLTPTLLHLPLDVLLGLIWILVPGIWALVLAEAMGLLPSELWLFPKLHKSVWLRLVVGFFALACFLAALLLNFGFQVYGQCVLSKNCQVDSQLELTIAGGFQTLLVATSLPASLGLLLGLCGLGSILFLVLWCVFSLVSRLFLLCAGSLQGLGDMAEELHERAHLPAYVRGEIDTSDTPIFTPPPVPLLMNYPLSAEDKPNKTKGDLLP